MKPKTEEVFWSSDSVFFSMAFFNTHLFTQGARTLLAVSPPRPFSQRVDQPLKRYQLSASMALAQTWELHDVQRLFPIIRIHGAAILMLTKMDKWGILMDIDGKC